ncbi:hypothetical protein FC11_GL000190 [Lactobacillus helveticus DSM 20075 = CGMCC 1.1877]|nr:hypothetical protein FC11_GL000190 [Lactobacillus helveticus DSM 20075 = CGMCC 1.1877]
MGIRQVEMARDYFQKHDVHFDKAFSSTQERACDTLEIITDHKMPYKRLKDLREQCYGIFEGQDEFLLPWNYNNPNGDPTMEKDEDVVGRMHRAITQILKGVNDGETALVVGHGDILAKYVRDVADPNFAGFANASIVKLSVDGKNVHLDTYVWPAESLKQN